MVVRCEYCDLVFLDESTQQNHERKVHDTHVKKEFKCDQCEKSFKWPCKLDRHIQFVHEKDESLDDDMKFTCTLCGKELAHQASLNQHMRIHTGEKPFKCKECGMCFRQRSALVSHHSVHIGKIFKCGTCDKAFSKKKYRENHERSHTGEKPFSCNYCDKSFISAQLLWCHKKTHKQEHNMNSKNGSTKDIEGITAHWCSVCRKMFATKASKQNHDKSIHDGLRPFKCQYCDKAFAMKGYLKIHERIHTGERPYACKFCGKTFTSSPAVKTHTQGHTGEKPHPCSFCGRFFARKEQVRIHERTHTGEKPFSCDLCDKAYRQSGDLKRHQRREHPVEMEHRSRMEGQSSSQAGMKRDSPRRRSGRPAANQVRKLFTCSQCSRVFSRKSALVSHLRTHPQQPQQLDNWNSNDEETWVLDETGQWHNTDDGGTTTATSTQYRTQQVVQYPPQGLPTPTGIQCPLCPFTTATKKLYVQHVINDHKDDP